MPRTFAGIVLPLAVLALTLPNQAVAGPPEVVSGKMVLDEVADGLRKYSLERDVPKRIRWLRRLAPTHDPRAAVALGEAMLQENREVGEEAAWLIMNHGYMGPFNVMNDIDKCARDWWKKNESDLRRRAKQLPQ